MIFGHLAGVAVGVRVPLVGGLEKCFKRVIIFPFFTFPYLGRTGAHAAISAFFRDIFLRGSKSSK